jgi:acyl-CoA thioester hydrolase
VSCGFGDQSIKQSVQKVVNMAEYHFYFPIKVRHADTDAQGHVFFGNYFTYYDEAVTGYLDEIGISAKRMAELGLDFFYVNAQSDYKGSARSGELLKVGVRVARIGNTSVTFDCVIYRESDFIVPGQAQPIASGIVTAVVVNPRTREPARVPDEFRRASANMEGSVF